MTYSTRKYLCEIWGCLQYQEWSNSNSKNSGISQHTSLFLWLPSAWVQMSNNSSLTRQQHLERNGWLGRKIWNVPQPWQVKIHIRANLQQSFPCLGYCWGIQQSSLLCENAEAISETYCMIKESNVSHFSDILKQSMPVLARAANSVV